MRHHLLLASVLFRSLAACGDRQPEQPATTAEATPAAAPTSIEDVELIPRDALFGNPERANVQISPDGEYLSWIAPVDGVLNVWVAPAGDVADARAVTDDDARGIRQYFWSYRPDTLLYPRDTDAAQALPLPAAAPDTRP